MDNKMADELGVNVRIAAIQTSQAYQQMADGKPWDQLSENMRKTILYHHILEQVSANLGLSLRDNTQLRLVQFQAALSDVRLALGQAFLPIVHVALPLLTALARKIEVVFQYISAFTRALFGITGKGATKNTLAQTKATVGQTKAVNNLGKATEKAGKKARKAGEEAKRGVADFDEVHLLNETKGGAGADADAGGGAGAGGGGGADLGGLDEGGLPLAQSSLDAWSQVNEKVEELTKKFRKFLKASKGFQALKEGFRDLGRALEDVWNMDLLRSARTALGKHLPKAFDALMLAAGGALKTVSGFITMITGDLDGNFTQAIHGARKTTVGAMQTISGVVGVVFPSIGKKMNELAEEMDDDWKWFQFEFVHGSNNLKEVGQRAFKYLKDEAGRQFAEMLRSEKRRFTEMRNAFQTAVSEAITNTKRRWSQYTKDIAYTWGVIYNTIRNIMIDVRNTVKERAENTWEQFKAPFDGVYSWFTKNVVNPIKNAFSSINDAFGDSITGGFKGVYNKAVGYLNVMIKKLNNIRIPGVGKVIDIKTIPTLANGGITTGPTIAMIGDNPGGREVVSPLDKLQGMLTSAVLTAMQFNNDNNTGGDIVLNIDGRQFARIVKPHIDRENKRVGMNVRMQSI